MSKIKQLAIPDVKVYTPSVHEDERGFFYESYNEDYFSQNIFPGIRFVQDNHSFSRKGVLRGMHFQETPFGQGKLVRVISGSVFDVAVDIRKDSRTYLNWVSEEISAKNKKQIWIPEGFAHGFLALEDNTELLYKTTNYYSKKHEKILSYNDKRVNIKWPKMDYIINSRDSALYSR